MIDAGLISVGTSTAGDSALSVDAGTGLVISAASTVESAARPEEMASSATTSWIGSERFCSSSVASGIAADEEALSLTTTSIFSLVLAHWIGSKPFPFVAGDKSIAVVFTSADPSV
ncbi:MAG: hypothetical protein JNM40_05780 [Myxococcales bacterium]|nr:hypothetical protein [Myxococcales bacterium]